MLHNQTPNKSRKQTLKFIHGVQLREGKTAIQYIKTSIYHTMTYNLLTIRNNQVRNAITPS